jgi:hypothetical protein
MDRTDSFTFLQPNVNYLKLVVTAAGANNPVAIATLEVIGRKITSTGTAHDVHRTIKQTVAVRETTQTGYGKAEIDWNQI